MEAKPKIYEGQKMCIGGIFFANIAENVTLITIFERYANYQTSNVTGMLMIILAITR